MAAARGRLGAIYYPTGDYDINSDVMAQEGGASSGTGVYKIATAATRITVAMKPSATVDDFVLDPDALTPTAIDRPVCEMTSTANLSSPVMDATGNTATACYSLGQAGGFVNWRITAGPDMEDITELGDAWGAHVTTLRRWSMTAEGFWQDANFTVDAEAGNVDIDDSPMCIVAFIDIDNTSNYHRLVGFIEGVQFEVGVPVGGIVSKSITFTGHDGLFFRDAST
jgi:hypothetical protein